MKRSVSYVVALLLLSLGGAEAQDSVPQVDVQLLSQQIAFLQDANTRMANSYDRTLSFLTWFTLVLVTLVVGGSGIATYRAVRAMKKSLERDVEDSVRQHIEKTIEGRVQHLERVVQREAVIGVAQVDYFRPGGRTPPEEYELLKDRGFEAPRYSTDWSNVRLNADILVLDFTDTNDESAIARTLTQAAESIGDACVLVAYSPSGHSESITNLSKSRVYYTVANFPLRLVAACSDASHIAYALRQRLGIR